MLVAVSAENAIFVTIELDLVLDCTLEIDVNKNLAVGSNARDHAAFLFISEALEATVIPLPIIPEQKWIGLRPSREMPFFFMSSHAFHQVPWTQTGYSAAILSETSTPAGLLLARARIFHSLLNQ